MCCHTTLLQEVAQEMMEELSSGKRTPRLRAVTRGSRGVTLGPDFQGLWWEE